MTHQQTAKIPQEKYAIQLTIQSFAFPRGRHGRHGLLFIHKLLGHRSHGLFNLLLLLITGGLAEDQESRNLQWEKWIRYSYPQTILGSAGNSIGVVYHYNNIN